VARIFVSHSSLDQSQAEELKAWLASIGFEQAFLDFDKHTGIPPGADWERILYREIERAQAVILVLTQNWFNSKWCFAEFTQTRALGKAIFALIVAPSGETTIVSSDIQHLDLTSNKEDGLDRLKRELFRVARNAQGGFDWQSGRSPFPGLLSFEASDAAIFFGRDDDVLRAIERINARRVQGGAKLVAILGGSGSGKSSLLKAGILPRIARDKANFLVAPSFRPGRDPIRGLLSALHSIDLSLTRADLDAIASREDALKLVDRLRLAGKAPQATLVIAIDQAEEAFTFATKDVQKQFFILLSRLLGSDQPPAGAEGPTPADDHPSLCVLTLRADHLPDLQTAEGLAVEFEEFSLKPMPIDRLGQIVRGPAKIAGLNVDEGLIAALMRDAKTQDGLPLVAFVLRRLYDRHRADGVLTQAHYEAMRDGKLSPLEVAVRDAATEAMAKAKPTHEQLDALREAFVPALVRVNDEGGFVRQSARLDRLAPQAHELLRELGRARLIVIDSRESSTVVEVAHEALFRVWPLLAQWLEEEREFLVGRTRIEKSREDYTDLTEDVRAKALLTGILLERAKNWLIAHPQRFTAEEAAFISASVEEADRQERERAAHLERLRQAELARARAEEERAKEQAAAAKKYLRLAVAAAGVFALLLGFAVYFWFDARAAEREAKTNYNLAIDQAASNVDLIVDNYQAGRIATNLITLLITSAQQTVDKLRSDTIDAAAAKAKLLRAVSRAYIILSEPSLADKTGRQELAITSQYLAQNPSDPLWQELNERAQEEVAQSLYWKGDLGGALKLLQAAATATQALVAKYPDNKDYAQDLIEIYRFYGDSLRNQGNIEQAIGQYQNWLNLANRLAAKQPDEVTWLRDQLFAHQRMGDILLAKNKPGDARPQLQTYLDLATQAQAKEGDNKEFIEAIEIAHQRIGDSYFDQGDMNGALKEYQIYLRLAPELAANDQSNFLWNQDLEVAYQRVGEVYLRKQQYDVALKNFQTYLDMASKTLKKDENNGTALFDVTNATEKVGDALFGQKDYKNAMTRYQTMLTNSQTLTKKDPFNGIWNKGFAISYQRIAGAYEEQGDKADALTNYRSCAAIVVPAVLWDLRDRWPLDVTGYCKRKVAQLSASPSPAPAPH